MDSSPGHWLFGNKRTLWIVVIALLLIGAGIRLFDLTDLPLDFHPTRQLYSALKARGMYYNMLPEGTNGPQREIAIAQWHSIQEIEPPVIEMMSAALYRVFGEKLWFARLLSILFWVLGGIPLFLLSKRIAGANGAVIALGFYLFSPYGIIASRSFQPDPLMVSLIICALWAVMEWEHRRTQKWAWISGICIGLALFVKNVSVFPLFFAIVSLTLIGQFRKKLTDRQYWLIAVLAILPTALYTLYGLFFAGFLGQQFAFRFFPNLLVDPTFYLRWKEQIDATIGFSAFVFALSGIFLAKNKGSRLLAGLWLGYAAYSMTFAYHTITHDYYQLMLIPIASISLAPVVELIANKIQANFKTKASSITVRGFLAGVLLLAMSIQVWNARVDLIRKDFRGEIKQWQKLGELLGHPGSILTISEDYGYRLAYWGWQDVEAWLDAGDLNLRELDGREIDLSDKFNEKANGKSYLVVTQMNKLDDQPEIKEYIYATYPIVDDTDGHVIFDLRK